MNNNKRLKRIILLAISYISLLMIISQAFVAVNSSIGIDDDQEDEIFNSKLLLNSENTLFDGRDRMNLCNDILDWGTDDVDAEIVWGGFEDAVDTLPFPKLTGRGVNVAIIDSGIDYDHPDLAENYAGGYDFVVDDSEWFPETGSLFGPKDLYGHGTHVAGIIAASDNGEGIIGVAPEANIYALRVANAQGSISTDKVAAAINWCTDTHYDEDPNNDINVINISSGGTLGDYYNEIENAIDMAYLTGIVIVASSGNAGASSLVYPAGFWNVIAVGSISENHQKAPNSNYGTGLELVAPGVDIYSTLPTYHVTYNNPPRNYEQDYYFVSGTSQAAPFVAGICALFFEYNPNYTPAEIRVKLMNTAVDLGDSGWDEYYGYGMVCGWFLYDLDNDGLLNGQERYDYGTNPLIVDTDGDMLSDGVEVNTYGTNPLSVDSDGDTMIDSWEITYSFNPLSSSDKYGDPDFDGLENYKEHVAGSNPYDADTDNDGLTDEEEFNDYGTDLLNIDTDGDGYTDYYELFPPPLYTPSDPNDYNSIPTVGGGGPGGGFFP